LDILLAIINSYKKCDLKNITVTKPIQKYPLLLLSVTPFPSFKQAYQRWIQTTTYIRMNNIFLEPETNKMLLMENDKLTLQN
jgi:hypothetical protein